MQHYTSIRQSKKLLELGLSAESADMYYMLTEDNIPTIYPNYIDGDYYEGEDIPCWSLGALLEVMPLIAVDKEKYNPFIAKNELGYYVTYRSKTKEWNSTVIYNNPIEAAFNMVCWYLKEVI